MDARGRDRRRPIADLTGKRYGKLVVIEFSHQKVNNRFYRCKCDCGKECLKPLSRLANGSITDCGCVCESPEYVSWKAARARCAPHAATKHSRKYREMGITFFEGWDDFQVFLEYMGPRPEGTELDRIDPTGNYEPGNVRWLSRSDPDARKTTGNRFWWNGEFLTCAEHARRAGMHKNTVTQRFQRGLSPEEIMEPPPRDGPQLLTLDGETKPLTEWAREKGLDPHTVRSRIFRNGWSVEEALNTETLTNWPRRT